MMGGQTPILVLREGTTRERGKGAQANNIQAALAISDAVRSTLGPKGMDKMLVDSMGDVTITNDGVTILKEVDVEHPAAKMIVEVAKTQDNECGDGTTTAVVLAGELLKKAQDLLDSAVHPTVIANGYRMAATEAKSVLAKNSFTVKNLGDWSGKQVPAIQPGEKVWLDGPHGVFSMDREQGMGYVFVAGGIGVTPLYSMLQTMEEREDVRPVVFFYGANTFDDMTFLDELIELSKRMPNLKPVPVITNPPKDWEGETGYITAEIMHKYLPKEYRRFKYLICGPKPLMDALEVALPELGVPPHNVLTERFDMV